MGFHSDSTSTISRRDRRVAAASAKSRRAVDTVGRAARQVIEQLERRQLMAVLNAGEVGYFQNAQGQAVRVTVDGDGSFAFVGSTRDTGSNQAFLNDIPMSVFADNTPDDGFENLVLVRENLGGFAGRDGIAPIDEVTGDTGGNSFVGRDLDGLASSSEGTTFGFAYRTAGTGFGLDLLYLNPNNGAIRGTTAIEGDVRAALLAGIPGAASVNVTGLIGADFRPGEDRSLYFLVNVTYALPNGAATQPATGQAMLIYDNVDKSIRLADDQFLGNGIVAANTNTAAINDFTFVDRNTIAFFGSRTRGGDTVSGLFFDRIVNDGITLEEYQAVGIPVAGAADTPVTTVAALEYITGQNYFIAVSNRTGTANLLRIELGAGGGGYTARVIGSAVDPDEPADVANKRGGAILDLAYNPRVTDNAFRIGKRGVLLGADGNRNEIVGFDTRDRFPRTDLYAVYGRDTTQNTSLAISIVDPNTEDGRSLEQSLLDGTSLPYTGGAGALRTLMAPGTGQTLTLGNGGVFIGGRVNGTGNQLNTPVYGLNLSERRGDSTGGNLPDVVLPGIYIDGAMDNVMIGGTITGRINIAGSVDTFYAGNIVTGNVVTNNGFLGVGGGTTGTFAVPTRFGGPADNISTVDNFFVGGDLRNLLVAGGIGMLSGAADIFEPGTDIAVAGKVGQVRAALEFRAGIDVAGKTGDGISDESNFIELETREVNNIGALAIGEAFHGNYSDLLFPEYDENFQLVQRFAILNQGFANNDSFATPQILGSFRSADRVRGQQIQISGTIDGATNVNDDSDFFGLPLLAGQSVVAQLTYPGYEGLTTGTSLQVYDPDGNLVTSDESNQNPQEFLSRSFSFTADQPGLWRIVVAPATGFAATIAPYTLTLDKVGEMSMGGLSSSGDIYLHNENIGVRVRTNDLGAILAGGDLYGGDAELLATTATRDARFTNPITAVAGNIRSIEAANLSFLYTQPNLVGLFPNIIAGKSIGLIKATAAAGRLYFNLGTNSTTGTPSPNYANGGDIQVVETRGDAAANLIVNGGVGIIRVGSWGANDRYFRSSGLPGFINLNADNRGGDGYLGLFDVVGDLGTFQLGGPAIDSGNGSNIRYIRVGGAAYRDRQFGIGQALVDTFTNQAFSVPDDSGATITLTPLASTTYTAPIDEVPVDPTNPTTIFGTGVIPNPFGSGYVIPNPFGGTPTAPTTDVNGDGVINADDVLTDVNGDGIIDELDLPGQVVDENGNVPGVQVSGQLIVETYPVRGGGVVVLTVRATQGLQINSSGTGPLASGDVTTVETGSGTASLTFGLDPAANFGFNTATDAATAAAALTARNAAAAAAAAAAAEADPTASSPAGQFGSGTLGSGTTLEVLMTGIRTNVMEISGTGGTAANYTRIVNATDGEILNLNALDVAYLEAQYLGVSRPIGGLAIEGLNTQGFVASNITPSRNQISMNDGLEIRSRGAIGNISASGIIQNVQANSDNVNVKGLLEGIVAPVYAAIDLHNVDYGEGLTDTGTGRVIQSGIFAGNLIGNITNRNGGGDLRGDVIAYDRIDSIVVTGGGSIINADILQIGSGVLSDGTTGFAIGNEGTRFALNAGATTNVNQGIGNITVDSPGGGIINTVVTGFNHGITTVTPSGFGILNSSFVTAGSGRMGGLVAGGLGIRNTTYIGGSETGNIIATGGGNLADLNDYSLSVRSSAVGYYDSATGRAPNAALDIFLMFQTSPSEGQIVGVTNEGIIADSNFAGSGSIGTIRALDFRTFNNPLAARPRDANYPSQINFGQNIGSIVAKRDINGLSVTSGTIGQIVARDIKSFQLQATAAVGTINAKRNISGSVNFNIINEGSLEALLVGGNMGGTMFVAQGIGRIVVDGDVASQYISGGIYSGQGIGTVRIGGDVREGSYIRARKKLGGITINGDLQATATIRANPFGTVTIKGDRLGTVREG